MAETIVQLLATDAARTKARREEHLDL